ncbi:MAG: Omp28-related outer membrane protein [Ignavibacteriae bacterium]|nr:Omp28-related outer membrane protein [Ignavibacteriota bacterium]
MKKLFTIILFLFLTGFASAQTNNVLLEFCTGTWCGYCPCGDAIAETIAVYRPDALILAYHGGSTSEPFKDFNGNNILSLMGFSAYPTGVVGRRTGIISRNGWFGQCMIQTNNYPSPISYTANRHYNPATRMVDMTVIATALRDIDTNCFINFVITEDNIVYPQNYYAECGTAGYHNDFIHKWVVRNMVNGATGEALNTGHWAQGTTKTKTWTTTLPSGWVYTNCKTAVFAYFQGSDLSYTSYVLQTKKESVSTFPTGVENQTIEPLKYNLEQNYPNPFNPVTNIHFSIPKDGYVSLKFYNILGTEVATYADGFMKAGTYNAEFDGSKLSSGIYFYKLTAGEFSSTKKMILTK